MKLSEKLIKLRKEKGLSQEEFGNEINVSRQTVSKWENEEAKPEVDKIREIVKKFNVNYDYLLNDEIELKEGSKNISDNNDKKTRYKIILKVIFIIFLLYLLICVYKFIAFYRFYLIANSFSEENYSMIQSLETSSKPLNDISTRKVGNKILQESYSLENSEIIKDKNGDTMPSAIEFTDIDKKISYQLNYDREKNKYIYRDRKKDMINNQEIEGLFKNENRVKENTLDIIPSNFKEIFFASIDPRYYYVSIANRQFKVFLSSDDAKIKVQLNKDYLVESMKHEFKYNELIRKFNYDYVQDHFKELKDPQKEYSDKILYEEE